MKHQHIYDSQGKQLCCTLVEKVEAEIARNTDEHDVTGRNIFRLFFPSIISFVMLAAGMLADHWIQSDFWHSWVRAVWYLLAYIPVGVPVWKEAFETIAKGEIFTEFFLMGIATIGAFAIGEYPEGVAVMLFYSVGEIFQALAVNKAKGNIKALLDQRPDTVTLIEDNVARKATASTVGVGAVVQLKPGEKVALDGMLVSDAASFNSAALTGESHPDDKQCGDTVLAGMINLNSVALVEVTTPYANSKLSNILNLVQNATTQKAKTELFIRKFAKYYTPAVVFAAMAICLLPMLFVSDYVFSTWLYRALIFLVISCPCALVISIPLSYFGGIGAASHRGILFKGGNFLDAMATVQYVAMDKTGTLTKGVFTVRETLILPDFNKNELLQWVNAVESKSTHPVASAIHQYVGTVDANIELKQVEEFAGLGLKAVIDGKTVLVGNTRLFDKFNIAYDTVIAQTPYTVVAIAVDGRFAGYITIADEVKEDAKEAVANLHKLGVKTVILSGDKSAVVNEVAAYLNIDKAYGDLLPEGKVNEIKKIKANGAKVAFVGDGFNDAPVIALSDIGIAMGGLGSDAAIETADVVIQDDKPSKIATAIGIGKATRRIVWQNITMAFVVKGAVLILGAGGLANMWEAVFADVGVALLAVLNAMRIQRIK